MREKEEEEERRCNRLKVGLGEKKRELLFYQSFFFLV